MAFVRSEKDKPDDFTQLGRGGDQRPGIKRTGTKDPLKLYNSTQTQHTRCTAGGLAKTTTLEEEDIAVTRFYQTKREKRKVL